ncbi:hypothetical protein Q8F55_000559 [Vanrija albida]|uniref:Alginate lyase 2 domain-containing protein n=1 Tax=Vanrija albida TaxID=181172 RepID=A0ABR3QDL9_9TREE
MLLITLAAAALAAPALATTPGAWFKVPSAPASGFEAVSASFYIDPASSWTTGYYAATQWSFQGHDVLYFGLQPRSRGDGSTTGHLTYSVFGAGSHVGDTRQCAPGADGGDGASCWLDIDFSAGRWYTIDVEVVQRSPDGSRRWNGTFVDDKGTRTYIASFWTDKSYGALGPNVAQWLEYYPFNGGTQVPAERECQPWFKILFGKPTVPGQTAVGVSLNKGAIDDKCAVAHGQNNYISEWTENGSLLVTAGIFS